MTIKECTNCPAATDHTTEECWMNKDKITHAHLPGLLLARRECRRYEDLQFLGFLIEKAQKAQPQPSAAQSAPGEREAFDKWFSDYSLSVRMNGGYMNDAQMFDAWQARAAWQRAQSAPAGAVPVAWAPVNKFGLIDILACSRFKPEQDGWVPLYSTAHPCAPGFKLVPVDPTPEMEEAGCHGYMNTDGAAWVMHNSSMGHAYRAMLAAAPQPAARQEQGDEVRRLREALRNLCEGMRSCGVPGGPYLDYAERLIAECDAASTEGKE